MQNKTSVAVLIRGQKEHSQSKTSI